MNLNDKNNSKKEKGKLSFEDCLSNIDTEIAKKRHKWNLRSLSWMDYDDVAQMLRFHIFKKWHLYDPKKQLNPWIRTIISNQIKNLIRNNYSNFVKPCNKCEAAIGEAGCEIYKSQCSSCPLYKNWEKNKKDSIYTKMPLSLENYKREVFIVQNEKEMDMEKVSKKLHAKMKEILKPNEWVIYDLLYIKNKEENEVAKIMGFKTSEKNRDPGYKHIKNIKKKILEKAKSCIYNNEIDIY